MDSIVTVLWTVLSETFGSYLYSGNRFSLQHYFRTTEPPVWWVLGVLPLGVNRQGREALHSYSSSTEVKDTCYDL
jgi:hypothetical protein